MNDVDRAIRQALSAEDAALLDRLDANAGLNGRLLVLFERSRRLFDAAGLVAGFALFAVAAVAAWRFMQTTDVVTMLRLGALASLALAGLAMVKLWFWMELQRASVIREVKRLELQVASLAAQSRTASTSGSHRSER